MIAQIGPLVQAGKRSQTAAIHILGGLTGGVIAGVPFALLGTLLATLTPSTTWPSLLGLASVCLLAALGDSELVRLPTLGARQTPRSWTCAFGEAGGVFAWGVDLGAGLTTRIISYLTLAMPAYALLSGRFFLGVAAFSVFGGTRAANTVFIALRSGRSSSEVAACLGDDQRLLFRTAALASITLAAALIVVSV